MTINLKGGRYELSQPIPLEYPDGAKLTTIKGVAGARATTIDGNGLTRVLSVIEGGVAVLDGVTVTGGDAAAGQTPSIEGGGIWLDAAASLSIVRSVITGNRAVHGGGIWSDGSLVVNASTISGNTAVVSATDSPEGGGIFHGSSGSSTLINTTVSGNTAVADPSPTFTAQGGGIFELAGALELRNVTVARNQAEEGGGIYNSDGNSLVLSNTIVADSLSGGACDGLDRDGGSHSLDDDNTCGLSTLLGDKPSVDPRLGPLANNGGATNTQSILPSSPAFNAGLNCESTDQRGVARPQLAACDIGAYEYRSPRLTVVKRVVNDQGGTQKATDFKVHLRRNGADVGGSPKPGSSTGTTYSLIPGTYVVGEDSDSRYTAAISGSCAANGLVTLAEGQSKSCTITNSDKPPVIGKLINAEPEGGTVKVKPRGRKHFHKLVEGEQLPSGTIVDTRKGRIGLIAAANKNGGLAKADFFDGLFKLTQSKGRRPLTTLTLIEKLSCKGAGKASIAKKKKKKRRLWGDGKGRFRTKGQFSSATVRGTKWLVEDRCTSTLTRVKRGRVAVRDFVKHKTVIVKAGKRYTARKK